jgi:hypothetical protein
MCSKTNLCKRHRTPQNYGIAIDSVEQEGRAKAQRAPNFGLAMIFVEEFKKMRKSHA